MIRSVWLADYSKKGNCCVPFLLVEVLICVISVLIISRYQEVRWVKDVISNAIGCGGHLGRIMDKAKGAPHRSIPHI